MNMRASTLLVLTFVTLFNTAFAHKDATQGYYQTWEKADELVDGTLPMLRDFKIILVPGFLSDAIIDLGPWGLKATHLGEYYDTQVAWMRSEGVALDVVRIDHIAFPSWDSENSIVQNAEVIAEVVRQSAKPVLIIAHSKGGLDTLEMLLRHPELLDKVKGFVALQSPFKGSPIADCVSDQEGLNFIAFELLKMLGGTKESLLDLRSDVRARYLLENAAQIDRVAKALPILSVGSVKKDESFFSWDTLLEPFRNKMDSLSLENDGLVPLASSELKDVEHVTIRSHGSAPFGIDHAVTVMECQFISFDRVRFMKTILAMLQARVASAIDES